MAPEIGNRAARVAKHRATSSWPANTTGHVQKNAAPPKAKPRKNSWKTVVRMETEENRAANDAKLPTRRCGSCLYPKRARSACSPGCCCLVDVMTAPGWLADLNICRPTDKLPLAAGGAASVAFLSSDRYVTRSAECYGHDRGTLPPGGVRVP